MTGKVFLYLATRVRSFHEPRAFRWFQIVVHCLGHSRNKWLHEVECFYGTGQLIALSGCKATYTEDGVFTHFGKSDSYQLSQREGKGMHTSSVINVGADVTTSNDRRQGLTKHRILGCSDY